MFYTSYFDNIENIPDGIVPVSISGKAPDWYEGLQYKKLAPKWWFFSVWKETHDNNYYIEMFAEHVLKKRDIAQVLGELYALASTNQICLLCYEKPGEFCHRHIVAEWFKSNGIECEEL